MTNRIIIFKYLIRAEPRFYTYHYLIDDFKLHNATKRKNKQNTMEIDHDYLNKN